MNKVHINTSVNCWEKKHWIQIRMANLKEEVVIILQIINRQEESF